MTLRLEPLLGPSRDVVLVGDPRRAFALAQAFTTEPRMAHIARGLWGYLGGFGPGSLTVQSTGAGGGPAAAVVTDLARLGVRRIIRMGTCESTDPALPVGSTVTVEAAIGLDGASRTLCRDHRIGDPPRLEPDPELAEALSPAGPTVEVTSHDLTGRLDPRERSPVRDLQTASVLAAARSEEVAAAAILVVIEDGSGDRLPEKGIEDRFASLATVLRTALDQPSG